MKLSALALSQGLPLRPIEPISPALPGGLDRLPPHIAIRDRNDECSQAAAVFRQLPLAGQRLSNARRWTGQWRRRRRDATSIKNDGDIDEARRQPVE